MQNLKICLLKKASGEEYSNEEYESFLESLERINTLVKLELESRIEKLGIGKKV
ncbi:MAG: hypothetical protein PG981_000922 [Wolbachia endosymbiont of Ctenocephalides orientis wCori]|nr:MAG: hypothetical protein PG981_000922 [Wolbachia endosymbiont of Ctenocephalides orientis wCori]